MNFLNKKKKSKKIPDETKTYIIKTFSHRQKLYEYIHGNKRFLSRLMIKPGILLSIYSFSLMFLILFSTSNWWQKFLLLIPGLLYFIGLVFIKKSLKKRKTGLGNIPFEKDKDLHIFAHMYGLKEINDNEGRTEYLKVLESVERITNSSIPIWLFLWVFLLFISGTVFLNLDEITPLTISIPNMIWSVLFSIQLFIQYLANDYLLIVMLRFFLLISYQPDIKKMQKKFVDIQSKKSITSEEVDLEQPINDVVSFFNFDYYDSPLKNQVLSESFDLLINSDSMRKWVNILTAYQIRFTDKLSKKCKTQLEMLIKHLQKKIEMHENKQNMLFNQRNTKLTQIAIWIAIVSLLITSVISIVSMFLVSR